MHEVLVNRLGGLSLPRKSVVRLTDRPDMTLDVYCGRKTTIQKQQFRLFLFIIFFVIQLLFSLLKHYLIHKTIKCLFMVNSFKITIKCFKAVGEGVWDRETA